MKTNFHLIVIGAGAGGLGPAIGMAKFGFDVLLIEKNRNNFGGDCLHTGCIPSKALIHLAEIIHQAHQAQNLGWKLSGKTNIKKVKEYLEQQQDKIWQHEKPEFLEKEEGISIEIGEASFTGKNRIAVNGREYTAKNIVVATGSRPKSLSLPGMDTLPVYTNESLFKLEQLPENLLVIGGGPIGVEMSQALSRLGSKVNVAERGSRILSNELPEVSSLLQKRLEKEGISFHFKSQLQKIEQGQAFLENNKGAVKQVAADAILLALGRELDYQPLKLSKAGIKLDEKGKPQLDSYLRASGNKKVYFAGDAAGGPFFSHTAELHTTVILTNFFAPGPFKKKFSLDNFSWVTFTNPQVATFGLSENQLQERGIGYNKLNFSFKNDDRAIASDYQYGRLILFSKKNALNPRKGKILGGTVVAPNAGEMIQELILAREKGLGLNAIFNKTYPYPTQGRVHKVALVEKFGSDISKWIKRGMKLLYR